MGNAGELNQRVVRAAECVLDVKGYVSPIELLKQMGLLAPAHVRMWEKGVYECLEPHIQCGEKKLVEEMTAVICEQYPGCPPSEAREIAFHTARRGSGRVGRSAAGRQLHAEAIRLAVVAHVRHEHTRYDELLMTGCARKDARHKIAPEIDRMVEKWKQEL